jgi:proteasome lid subunit RPN8/RPN11
MLEKREQNGSAEGDIGIELNVVQKKGSVKQPKAQNVFVEIDEQPSRFVVDFSGSETSHELAGVLLGGYVEKDGHLKVVVNAAIEAKYTDASRGSVTFTHKSWEYINQTREELYPQLSIVGWFHTHPGFGIFLSGFDKFIHQNFFNLPWQVAYVLDPIAGTHGMFGWQNGSLVQVQFNAPHGPRDRKTVKAPMETTESADKPQKVKPVIPYGRFAMTALLAALLAVNGYLFATRQQSIARTNELSLMLQQEREKAEVYNLALTGYEETLEELQEQLSSESSTRGKLEDELERLTASPDYLVHIVTATDTLVGISEKYLGDPGRYMELARLNKLENPDLIITGEPIIIPVNHER